MPWLTQKRARRRTRGTGRFTCEQDIGSGTGGEGWWGTSRGKWRSSQTSRINKMRQAQEIRQAQE
eukprot:1160316-Pelagomonas_calceolata.AAC.13